MVQVGINCFLLMKGNSIIVGAQPKYFDYLDDCSGIFQERLGCDVDFAKEIKFSRLNALDNPATIATTCRRIAEVILRSLFSQVPEEMKFANLIELASEKDIINKGIYHKFNEIRIKGNKGAHGKSVEVIEVKNILELLDDIFRYLIIHLDIDRSIPETVPRGADEMFLTHDDADLLQKASAAASISGNSQLENEARNAIKIADELRVDVSEKALDIEERLIQMEIPLKRKGYSGKQLLALENENKNFAELAAKVKRSQRGVEVIREKIESVLQEYDYINKLLRGEKRATEKQFEVMAFPRSVNTVTNVLQVAGEAGTGKTLCLIAKLIMDVRESDQISFLDEGKKKALFVCFNKNLASYVRGLINNFPGDCGHIEVESYDVFINQLVRQKPRDDYRHLSVYARDIRNGKNKFLINKEIKDYIKKSMERVSQNHSGKSAYYLDFSNGKNITWVSDEILWLESRYDTLEQALELYPSVSRTGRGGTWRPNANDRAIILEIWQEFIKLLSNDGKYTIGQATKQLMRSASLPKYDAIAIDEAQDFTLSSLKLLLGFRLNNRSRVYISGDENQKIYQRDFSWKDLDSNVKGYTITLSENKRNSRAIQNFANRLLGKNCSYQDAKDYVHVGGVDEDRLIRLIEKLVIQRPKDTVALITSEIETWEKLLRDHGLPRQYATNGITTPGIYCLGNFVNKGLEFDTVIVDYSNPSDDLSEEEKRLRYVHFTRARRYLYVRYENAVPLLLREYYSDFL